MNLAVFSAKPYDREYLSLANTTLTFSPSQQTPPHTITFHDFTLSAETAPLARGPWPSSPWR
ncbi:hypothetical protein C8A00DRAFT_30499 [Chaetomidium leptoderma]|uniref:Uncharacterized protein n=1 Tax=Chaetomidium leptoderma TaxID=669021 RepID=A0AAN6VUV7_9PEZI|nr:hypothetical protein C8A00DRAFT_30499 [Chaetomidium leptoderma]